MTDEKTIDLDTGRLRMSFGTLVTIIGAVVAGIVAAVTWGVGTATKADVESAMKQAAPSTIVEEVKGNTETIRTVSGKLDKVSDRVDQGKEEIRYIRGRIDFLTEQSLIEAQTNPRARARVQKAAIRVRKAARAAGDTDDPLQGINDL